MQKKESDFLQAQLNPVQRYHQESKHSPVRYANGPESLDWANQPNPFRQYIGAELIPLDKELSASNVFYDQLSSGAAVPSSDLNKESISRLFYFSLAISSWKRVGSSSWALRVNPSSGNLHPTEGYLLCGPIKGLCEKPMLCHYSPAEHGLEVRTEFSQSLWQQLWGDLPPGTFFVGLSSIFWREAWKYGLRSFRYSQLDIGHALGAISLAAAALGWQVSIVDAIQDKDLKCLLGLDDKHQGEEEHPEVLLAIGPGVHGQRDILVFPKNIGKLSSLVWHGESNLLSQYHHDWSLDTIIKATQRHHQDVASLNVSHVEEQSQAFRPLYFESLVRQRRSAMAMDPNTSLSRDHFYRIIKRVASLSVSPFTLLLREVAVHLVLFVHRVDDMEPGIYCLVRDPGQQRDLQKAFSLIKKWHKVSQYSEPGFLYLLESGNVQDLAGKISCNQKIAADSCFSLAMIAKFESSLRCNGPWFYRRLFWEAGLIGQVLYLEAEALSIRGTGIGCYFDDTVHDILGIQDQGYQDLYHFTVGGSFEDERIQTLPAYQ